MTAGGEAPAGAGEPPPFDAGQIDRLLADRGDDLDDARFLLRHLLAEAPVAHIARSIQPHFTLDYVSPNSPAIVGQDPERFVSTFDDWAERLDPVGRGQLTLQYLQMVTGEADRLDLEVALDDERGRRALNVSLADDAGTGRLVGHMYDATRHRQLREELAQNQQVIEGVVERSPDIFVVTDLEGTITFLNPVTTEIVGFGLHELMGRSIYEILHPDDAVAVEETFWSLRPGDLHPGVVRARVEHQSGGWVTLDIRSKLLVDDAGQVTGVIGICREASGQLELERRLRESKEGAERASRAKDEFLSRMSHELRTPLNAVLGFAQLLDLSDLDEGDRESVEQIRRAGSHLLQLIDEVLDIARIEAGRFTLSLEPVDVREAVVGAVDLVSPLAHQQGVLLLVDEVAGLWVRADRHRLSQIVLNLLSNAVKFNHRGGSVELWATTDLAEGTCQLVVRDTGPGIERADLERLFQPFERLEADQQGIAGTGIGLALSRALAKQMGGSLVAHSAVGEGTTLALTLPLSDAQRPGAVAGTGAARSTAPEGTGTLRILYIEDNHANRELVEHALRWRGSDELVAASQGQLGLTLAAADPPDVVLLDLHLPDMDGVDVLRSLRAGPATAATPVIVLSADATSRQIHRVLDEGADHYLTKPVDLTELLGVLERYRR